MDAPIEHQLDLFGKQEFPQVSRRERGTAKDLLRARVLDEYENTEDTLGTIAGRHGISIATITIWAKKEELPLRGRGRNIQKEPSTENKEILSRVSGHSYQEIGREFGISKSRVGGIVKRWRDWARNNGITLPEPPTHQTKPPATTLVAREPKSVVLTFRLSASEAGKLKYSAVGPMSQAPSLHVLARSVLLNAINSPDATLLVSQKAESVC